MFAFFVVAFIPCEKEWFRNAYKSFEIQMKTDENCSSQTSQSQINKHYSSPNSSYEQKQSHSDFSAASLANNLPLKNYSLTNLVDQIFTEMIPKTKSVLKLMNLISQSFFFTRVRLCKKENFFNLIRYFLILFSFWKTKQIRR